MTDVLLYWRDYKRNWLKQFVGERLYYWHSSARILGDLQAGDHLWMVTSGDNVGHEVKQAGFLVAIWTVEDAFPNAGDDPAYSRDKYRFRITADPSESIVFAEPVLVDHILRPPGRDRAVSIGRFLQGPRKLDEQKLRLLRAAAGPDLALEWLVGRMRDEG
jgi:hypothetical protein